MSKLADVKLKWKRSPSGDIDKRRVTVTINGEANQYDVGPEVSELMIEVQALGKVQFFTEVFDTEGNVVSSETATFSLGDLEVPLPDTELDHEVVAVRDVPDPTPTDPPSA